MAPSPGFRLFVRYWLPALAYVALVFSLSSMPALRPPVRFPNADKVIHMTEYAILGWLLVRALRTLPPLSGALAAGLVALAIGAAVGVADELHQRSVPGRETSALDWIADMLGLSLAQVAYLWAKRSQIASPPAGAPRDAV